MSDHLYLEFPPMVAGNTYAIDLTVVDNAGAAVDISGAAFWLTLKLAQTQSDEQAELQYQVTAPANATSVSGVLKLKVPAATTAPVDAGSYYVDVQMKDASDDVFTVAGGTIPVMSRVTQGLTPAPETSLTVIQSFVYSAFTVESA